MMNGTAIISANKKFRYLLTRTWSESSSIRYVNFIGLNPSTADAKEDDATIRRCIRFAKDWGYDGLSMTNLCAYRSRDPGALRDHPHHMTSHCNQVNDRFLAEQAQWADLVICCWGTHGVIQDRGSIVHRRLKRLIGDKVMCLGLTKDGFPKHPLRLPASTQPTPW